MSSRGFALAAALFALLVIAALAAGAFAAARDEAALGGNSFHAEQAFGAAEAGLSAALARGASGGWGSLQNGDSLAFAGDLPAGSGQYSASVLRLSGQLFLVRAAGRDAPGRIERRLAMVARLELQSPGLSAALTALGPATIEGSAFVDGRDADPPGWTGCPPTGLDTVAGVEAGAGQLRLAGCEDESCIAGRPPIRSVSVARDSATPVLGGLGWEALVRLAEKSYAGGGAGGAHAPGPSATDTVCDRARPDNWGEPARPARVPPCVGYFPVIRVPGDFTLAGGRGQGVLLVDGDLTVTGGAEFAGAVLVRGAIRSSGAGGRIRGGVVAMGGAGSGESDLALALVTYSSCALGAAVASLAPVRALRERSWAEIR